MTTFKVDGEGCVGLNEETGPSTPEQYHESEEIYPVARAHEFLILMRGCSVRWTGTPGHGPSLHKL